MNECGRWMKAQNENGWMILGYWFGDSSNLIMALKM
jgi:hypothetical protein